MQDAEGIAFVHAEPATASFDMKLVKRAPLHSGDKRLPDAGVRTRRQGMAIGVPVVKAANDGDAARVGRPHTKGGAGLTIALDEMSAEFVVQPVVTAFVEEIEVLVGKQAAVGDDGGFRVRGRRHGLNPGLVYRREASLDTKAKVVPCLMYMKYVFMYVLPRGWLSSGILSGR